jgi:cytochrome c peroxidase
LIAAALGPELAAVAEAQFSRIFGVALAAYEATLVPDQTPFDRFLAGDGAALTASEQLRWEAFNGDAQCSQCHAGSELSDATLSFADTQMAPSTWTAATRASTTSASDRRRRPRPRGHRPGLALPGRRVARLFDRGAFKTPGLRNVALTAPYMHDGGISTLAEVVDFYHDRGFFANPEQARLHARRQTSRGGERAPLIDFLTGCADGLPRGAGTRPLRSPSLPLANATASAPSGAKASGPAPEHERQPG